ncbi:hypothetical protein ACWDTI_17135 [Gordonia sp. NPDC003424]
MSTPQDPYGRSQPDQSPYGRQPPPGGSPGQPQYDQPQYGEPQHGQPHYSEPQFGQSQYGEPQHGQPQYGQPQYGQPQYGEQPGQPQYGQPQYGQPQYDQPQYGRPPEGQPQPGGPQQPQYGQPPYGQPTYGQPQHGQPQPGEPYGGPAQGQPAYGQPPYGGAPYGPQGGAPYPGPGGSPYGAAQPAGVVVGKLSAIVPVIYWVIAGISVLIMISAFLPWVSAAGKSYSGMSGNDHASDGVITLILALIAGAVAVAAVFLARQPLLGLAAGVVAVLAGLVVAIIGFSDISDVNSASDQLNNIPSSIPGMPPGFQINVPDLDLSVGIGLWFTVILGVVLIVAGVLAAIPGFGALTTRH